MIYENYKNIQKIFLFIKWFFSNKENFDFIRKKPKLNKIYFLKYFV